MPAGQAELPFQPVGMRTRNGGSSKSRPPREEKRKRGTKHITMDFLEEGGYFDAPIQVCNPSNPKVTLIAPLNNPKQPPPLQQQPQPAFIRFCSCAPNFCCV